MALCKGGFPGRPCRVRTIRRSGLCAFHDPEYRSGLKTAKDGRKARAAVRNGKTLDGF